MGLSNVPGVVRRTGQECFGSWRTSAPSCSCIAFKNKQPPLCLQSTVLPDSKQIPRRRSSRRMSSIYTQARLKNDELQVVTEKAARAGAALVREAVDKPRNIKFKGATDLVTETDTSSEAAILQIIQDAFPNHAILGEEGGVSGDVTSEYLWCVDPLDGTTNFAHGYPSFAVSVACLHRAIPVAATVIEFAGGPGTWVQREYSAKRNGGATLNGESIRVSNTHELQNSLVVTGFGYEHDAPWLANMKLFQEFTDITRGVRRLGSAAIDMCHVACGASMSHMIWIHIKKILILAGSRFKSH